MPHMLKDHAGGRPQLAAMSDEQFAELKALLQPGFELSSLMLADYKAAHAPPPPNPSPVPTPIDPPFESASASASASAPAPEAPVN